MSTNRTKIDWAYKQAKRLIITLTGDALGADTRYVAAILRRAEKRGYRRGQLQSDMMPLEVAGLTIKEILTMKAELAALRPPLTVDTIRECEKQIKAVAQKPDANGHYTFDVARPIGQFAVTNEGVDD